MDWLAARTARSGRMSRSKEHDHPQRLPRGVSCSIGLHLRPVRWQFMTLLPTGYGRVNCQPYHAFSTPEPGPQAPPLLWAGPLASCGAPGHRCGGTGYLPRPESGHLSIATSARRPGWPAHQRTGFPIDIHFCDVGKATPSPCHTSQPEDQEGYRGSLAGRRGGTGQRARVTQL
jgi:hypothetical protein